MTKKEVLPPATIREMASRVRRNSARVAVVWLVVGLPACGDDGGIDRSIPADRTTRAVADPEPAFAWALDGDGVAAVGDVDLEFSGSHDLDIESVALDSVTGSATSARSGLIDTTQSFSVGTWVSLDHREEYATVVSQIGDVAAAFYLGYAEYQWSFNMKSADGPGGNVHAQAAP